MDTLVHRALNKACEKLNRTTGLQHRFVVRMSKADDTDSMVTEVRVVALNWSDAWGLVGDVVDEFMNDPHGRFVKSVEAVK